MIAGPLQGVPWRHAAVDQQRQRQEQPGEDAELAAKFAPLAKALADNEQKIVAELSEVQGKAVDIGGYRMG